MCRAVSDSLVITNVSRCVCPFLAKVQVSNRGRERRKCSIQWLATKKRGERKEKQQQQQAQD